MKFYFTFPINSIHKNCYITVDAPSKKEAREAVWEQYAQNWAFCYTEWQFLPQIKEYNLTEIFFNG